MRSIEEIKVNEKKDKLNHSDSRMSLTIKKFTGYHIEPDNMVLKEEYTVCKHCYDNKKLKYSYQGIVLCESCIKDLDTYLK